MSVTYLPRHDADNAEWPSPPDPGDLSRRLSRRRSELRLSTAQVAARAGLSQRYVDYLERYPARPDASVMRRLAAALSTSPAALLGGATRVKGEPATAGTFSKLTLAECWRLIAPGGIGRIAFCAASGPVILPVNYVVISGAIVFRVARGSLIEGHSYEKVAFEVDHVDDALCQGWSVLVSGQAHAVLQPMELRRLRAESDLRPWPDGTHEVWVRIAPDKITGRRVESQ
jgi:nitroimidazol reductase NimA-like FMN-containing flavoprotein (pyridoxamine 5'-phosphate oxidase superfamily)